MDVSAPLRLPGGGSSTRASRCSRRTTRRFCAAVPCSRRRACTAAGRSCSTGTSPALPRSSERVRLPPPDAAECERLAGLVVGACEEQDLALRLYWTGRALVATAAPIDPELEEQRSRGLRLATVSWSTGALAGAKSTSYAENMGAQDAAIAGGADDALLVGYDGTVLEAPTANVFWREGDRLLTPTLELPILAGVTRGLLLEIAERETDEGVFPLGRLLEADEVFLCSSIREVMPVASVDGTTFELGPAAHELEQALRRLAVPA